MHKEAEAGGLVVDIEGVNEICFRGKAQQQRTNFITNDRAGSRRFDQDGPTRVMIHHGFIVSPQHGEQILSR